MPYRKTKRAMMNRGRPAVCGGREVIERAAPWQEPELRKLIVVIDFDTGRPIVHMMALHRARQRRVDCYDAYIKGRLWKSRIGWSRALADIRKAFPRVMRD